MNSELTQQLNDLRLSTMRHSLMLQEEQPQLYSDLSFYDRLSLLLGEEITTREQRKIDRLVKQAKLRLAAHPSQIDYRSSRGIEKSKIRSLLEGHWLQHHQNLIFYWGYRMREDLSWVCSWSLLLPTGHCCTLLQAQRVARTVKASSRGRQLPTLFSSTQ